MELRHLQQITEICRTGSFTGAARRLRISQPTLSKSIAKLEKELAVKLFEREGGVARPTEYGNYLSERGESLLKAMAALKHDIALLAGGETGKLRIGAGAAARLKPMQDVISRAAERFPHLQIEARHERVDVLIRGLKTGRYDLVFCLSEGAEPYGELMRVKIFEDRNVVAVRPGHPLLQEFPISPAKLLRFPLAGFSIGAGYQRWFGRISPEAQKNLEAFVSDDYELIKNRPIGTDYAAFAPSFIFERHFKDGTLVELPVANLPRYECWMVTTRTRWHSRVVRAIAQIAKSANDSPKTKETKAKRPVREKR